MKLLLCFTVFACALAQNRLEDYEKLEALARMNQEDVAKATFAFWNVAMPEVANELLHDPAKFATTPNIPIGSLICPLIQKYYPKLINCTVNNLEMAVYSALALGLRVSSGCASDLAYGMLGNFLHINVADLLGALGSEKTFSLRQLDAWGKPRSGILEGNMQWPGLYSECTQINADTGGSKNYQGKYCKVYVSYIALIAALTKPLSPVPIPKWKNFLQVDYCKTLGFGTTITWGVCMPSQCSDKDVTTLTYMLTNSSTMASPVCGAQCIPHLPPKWTTDAIVILVMLSIFGALALFASLYDYFVYEPDIDNTNNSTAAGRFIKILMAFSFISNSKKIFDTTTKPGQINSIHGLRFISMSWVIIGHSYMWTFGSDNVLEVIKLRNKFTMQTIMNATFAVDTFFLLSGTLLSYLWFKHMFKSKGKLVKSPYTWIMFYVHRYLRLTPVYAIIFFSQNALYQYLTAGPGWNAQGMGHDNCLKYWWTNLLYVNNLVDVNENQCHRETWYLANDMQFHIFSPLILLPLWFFWPIGVVISVVLILASMGVTAWSYVHWHLPPPLAFSLTQDPDAPKKVAEYYWNYMYVSPWTRYSPYIIGILLGYFMQIKPKLKINAILNTVLWMLAAILASGMLYGLLTYSQGTLWNTPGRTIYSTLCRPLWSVAVAWVIYACFSGNGGPIDSILSWKVWIPLSRLTYCAYLLHITCAGIIGASFELPKHWTSHFNFLLTTSAALMIFAYIVSFFTSACFEMPIMTLEGMIFQRNKPTKAEPVAKSDSQQPIWSSVRPYQNGQIASLNSLDPTIQGNETSDGVTKRNLLLKD